MKTRRRRNTGEGSRTRVGVGLVAAAAGLAALWTGCTVTESNYKVLSYFFDGVPDPNAPALPAGVALGEQDLRRSPTYIAHKPYAEDNCAECHKSRFRLTMNDSAICMKCHAEEVSKHPRMHGPVAAGACLWCHSPHESAHAYLMRDRDRPVCMQCHSQEMLTTQRVPEHADEARGCLECHYGHGGPGAMFLRSGAAAPPAGDGSKG